jgi:hypothetical protein
MGIGRRGIEERHPVEGPVRDLYPRLQGIDPAMGKRDQDRLQPGRANLVGQPVRAPRVRVAAGAMESLGVVRLEDAVQLGQEAPLRRGDSTSGGGVCRLPGRRIIDRLGQLCNMRRWLDAFRRTASTT